jgi:hypothetical protein
MGLLVLQPVARADIDDRDAGGQAAHRDGFLGGYRARSGQPL